MSPDPIAITPERARVALAVERWVADVEGEYPSLDAALLAARSAAPLTESEIDEAVAHHPRIGEKPTGAGASAQFSRREQASAADADDAIVNAAIAAGNRVYEERFGRVFIIRAAGRSRAEILAELERRLALDPADELPIVGEQLVEIALLRLESSLAEAVASGATA
ncbi:2-oxo-4-hydroxy-4-carboxy-5-ureidoimidazoline decarboxylase [Galbitalea sp. SE-J8]|uniref:2-oxo-4-hydroxy-4-carboxy-5-ureidoimidazoline decarboxylase n=1 Tax=Galbitalea sp. SE-J8 TaxID=3054952 RepID=UPI00259D1F2F|nr:2-oxo-4-hydroxy-4-carboxy-5-ureidoimidazoline decarboxylase [Galbitalea sp. SE-J8]MDM4762856.1 2-oxo-4-hydroxy-4-carboxy-5-ureidoimidazoline decarboxylase [Galbitalea sp. SE-J8]